MPAKSPITISLESNSILRAFCGHRALFPLSLCFYFILPYVATALGLPMTNLSFPGVWVWGMLLVSLLSYSLGVLWAGRLPRIPSLTHHRIALLGYLVLSVLIFFYCLFLGLGSFLSAGIGGLISGATYLLFKREITPNVSLVLLVLSVGILLGEFVVLGGVPILGSTRLLDAKLSPIRRLALPIFLLGAVSLSLNWKGRVKGILRAEFPLFLIFAAGALLFLVNGARMDFFAVVFAYILLLLVTRGRKVRSATLVILAAVLIITPLLMPHLVGQTRQRFNFQVLRHILILVDNPLVGSAAGGISFGPRQNFLGPHMIYGQSDNWTLTSTWIGSAYLDFGIPGLIITMLLIAGLLEFLRIRAEGGENLRITIIYLSVLPLLLSLFQEGMDLAVVAILVAILCGVVTALESSGSRRAAYMHGRNLRRPIISVILGIVSILLVLIAFEAEFALAKPVGGIEKIAAMRTTMTRVLQGGRYYHLRIVGEGTQVINGNVTYSCNVGSPQVVGFYGTLWEAERDELDLGWIHPLGSEVVTYSFDIRVARKPTESLDLFLSLEESVLSVPAKYLIVPGIIVAIVFFLLAFPGYIAEPFHP